MVRNLIDAHKTKTYGSEGEAMPQAKDTDTGKKLMEAP